MSQTLAPAETKIATIGGDGTAEATGLHAVIAEFDSPGELIEAAREVYDAGYSKFDAHSPFPIHGIEAAMGIRNTLLPVLVFVGGVVGCLGGVLLQWFTNAVDYPFLVSGKPFFSLPANIPVIFETTVLLAAITAVFGMLVLNNLPLFYNALFTNARFSRVTNDKFFIVIEARDPRFSADETPGFLKRLGAQAVELVHDVKTPELPRWMTTAGLITLIVLLIPPAVIAKARVSRSSKPRIHIIQDMDNQIRFKAQQENPFFADGRAMRQPVAGTIARGDVVVDTHFADGRVDGKWVTTFPTHKMDFDLETLQRGQERFNIFCQPCHGMDGKGEGMVHQRAIALEQPGWVPPLSMNADQVVQRPVGHLYNTIKNGIRTMPAYGDQIDRADRWAIVAYIRALQKAESASVEEVPEQYRSELR